MRSRTGARPTNPGASDISRELLHHWFQRDHLVTLGDGSQLPFRYYFCQREAIETLIYLYKVRGARGLARLTNEFAGPDAETAALARVVDYIHLNPVRARVVPVERLVDFRWSSLHRFSRAPR